MSEKYYEDMRDCDLKQELVGRSIASIGSSNDIMADTITLDDGRSFTFHTCGDFDSWEEATVIEMYRTGATITDVVEHEVQDGWMYPERDILILAESTQLAKIRLRGYQLYEVTGLVSLTITEKDT